MRTLDTNRIKGISWLYAPIALVQYVLTRLNIRKAKSADINAGRRSRVSETSLACMVLESPPKPLMTGGP